MESLALALLRWVHLIAAVVWVGGMFMNLVFVYPTIRRVLGGQPALEREFTEEEGTRIGPWIIWPPILLVVTGWPLAVFESAGTSRGWWGLLFAKQAVWLAMAAVLFYVMRVHWPRMLFALPDEWPKLYYRIYFRLALLNFSLGVLAVALSALAAALR